MTEERVYKLENGKEKILMSTMVYKDKRYLLLLDEETDAVEVGFEKNGRLVYLDKNSEYYRTILSELYNKLKTSEI
jgi:hypothetical protein